MTRRQRGPQDATEENSQQRVRVVAQEVAKLIQCHAGNGISRSPVLQVSLPRRRRVEEGRFTWLYPSDMGVGEFPALIAL